MKKKIQINRHTWDWVSRNSVCMHFISQHLNVRQFDIDLNLIKSIASDLKGKSTERNMKVHDTSVEIESIS